MFPLPVISPYAARMAIRGIDGDRNNAPAIVIFPLRSRGVAYQMPVDPAEQPALTRSPQRGISRIVLRSGDVAPHEDPSGRWTMKIRIEKSRCVGHARCATIAGHLYPLDDEGYIAIEGFDVAPGDELMAKRGARACPERIIFVEDE
jgi:ferredoxin